MWVNHQKNVEKPDKYISIVKKHNLLKNSLYSAGKKIPCHIYDLWKNRTEQKKN